MHEPLKGQSETRAARIDDGLVLKSFAKLLWVCPTHAQLVEAACDLYIQRIKGFPSLRFKPWCYNAILCNWGCPQVELMRECEKDTTRVPSPDSSSWRVNCLWDFRCQCHVCLWCCRRATSQLGLAQGRGKRVGKDDPLASPVDPFPSPLARKSGFSLSFSCPYPLHSS